MPKPMRRQRPEGHWQAAQHVVGVE